jgi:hypothetical protein
VKREGGRQLQAQWGRETEGVYEVRGNWRKKEREDNSRGRSEGRSLVVEVW